MENRGQLNQILSPFTKKKKNKGRVEKTAKKRDLGKKGEEIDKRHLKMQVHPPIEWKEGEGRKNKMAVWYLQKFKKKKKKTF